LYLHLIGINLHHHEGREGVGAHALGHGLAAGRGGLAAVDGAAWGRHHNLGAGLARLGLGAVETATHDVGEHARRLGSALHALVGAGLAHTGGALVGANLAACEGGGHNSLGDVALVAAIEHTESAAVAVLSERSLGAVLLLTIGGHHEGLALRGHADHALLGVGKVGGLFHFCLIYAEKIFFQNPMAQ